MWGLLPKPITTKETEVGWGRKVFLTFQGPWIKQARKQKQNRWNSILMWEPSINNKKTRLEGRYFVAMLFQDHKSNNTGRWRTGGRLRAWGACCRFFRFTVDAEQVGSCWPVHFRVRNRLRLWQELQSWLQGKGLSSEALESLASLRLDGDMSLGCGDEREFDGSIMGEALFLERWDTFSFLLWTPQMCIQEQYCWDWGLSEWMSVRISPKQETINPVSCCSPYPGRSMLLEVPGCQTAWLARWRVRTPRGAEDTAAPVWESHQKRKTRLKRQPNQRCKSWLGCGSRTERRFRTCYRPTFWNSERPT